MLSSIWNLLVTEDVTLTKIITSPMVFFEVALIFLLNTNTFKLTYSKKTKFTYILFLSITSLITAFSIPELYNAFLNYFINFLFIKFLFKENLIKTIVLTIYPTILFAIISTLVLKPFLIITALSYDNVEKIPIFKMLYLSILYSIIFFITLILKNIKVTLHFVNDLNKKNRIIILLNTLLGFITLCIQLTITVFYTDVLPTTITILSFISLLAYFFISFFSLNKIMELQITTQNLESAENYNKTLSILYDNVKAFKHDFDNIIFTIGGFINTDDINGLKNYYNSLEKECQNINNISLLNPTLINNSGIYNLLTVKYQKAKEKNVDIQLEFFLDLQKLHMPIYDFSRILGIFLDNAIEAAASSNEKIIKVIFRDSQKSNVQIIQIENSYTNKNVDTNKIFKKGVTEKEQHLGMGLWEVMQILKRNNNVNLITEKNDLYFKQCLEIYY